MIEWLCQMSIVGLWSWIAGFPERNTHQIHIKTQSSIVSFNCQCGTLYYLCLRHTTYTEFIFHAQSMDDSYKLSCYYIMTCLCEYYSTWWHDIWLIHVWGEVWFMSHYDFQSFFFTLTCESDETMPSHGPHGPKCTSCWLAVVVTATAIVCYLIH